MQLLTITLKPHPVTNLTNKTKHHHAVNSVTMSNNFARRTILISVSGMRYDKF